LQEAVPCVNALEAPLRAAQLLLVLHADWRAGGLVAAKSWGWLVGAEGWKERLTVVTGEGIRQE